jgi:hypothetical protein
MTWWLWLVVVSIVWLAVGLLVGIAVGRVIRLGDERDEERQRKLEALAMGEDPKTYDPQAERPAVRPARWEASHRWESGSNGDS